VNKRCANSGSNISVLYRRL